MLSARAQARVHTGVSLPCWTDEAGDLRDRRGTVRYPREALSKALLGAVRDGGSRFQRSWGR